MIKPRKNCTCTMCPLRDKTRVWPTVPDAGQPYLAIFGEAPGAEEDRDGQPFVGPSGKLLNWVLGEVGIPRHRCFVGNVISCQPPENIIDGLEGTEAQVCCKPGLVEDLRYVYDSGCRTILALGVTAMHALGIEGPIGSYRGSVFEIQVPGRPDKIRVVPTYHPSAIMRQNWKRSGGGTADAMVLWRADISKAKDIADGNWTDLVEDFNLEPTADQVVDFIEKGLARHELFAVDTETTGLHPDYAQIVVIGLAISATKAISVPLVKEHGETYFKGADWTKVQGALRKLFSTGKQLYQNCFFDVPMLRKSGFAIPYELIVHDTLLLHHTLAAESKHDLGTIVSIYGKTPYWKEEFKNRTVSILEMNQVEMRRYNLRDCVVLHQVLGPMLKDLAELGLTKMYLEEVIPLVGPIMDMTQTGLGIDQSRVRAYKKTMLAKVAETKTALYELGHLTPGFSVDSGDHLRWLFYGVEPSSFAKLTGLATKKAGTKLYQELLELKEIKDNIKPIYQLDGWTPRTTDSNKLATNKQALLGYQIQLNNRLAYLRNLKKDTSEEQVQIQKLLDFIVLLGKYNLYRKLVSTYTDYKPWKDGRIHPRWLMHGTVSGRLSCLSGESLITTTRGIFKIQDYQVQLGDKILTHKNNWKPIIRKFNQGVKPVIQLTTETGRSIICTPDHRFWTPQGWIAAGSLYKKEVYCVNIQERFTRQGAKTKSNLALFGKSRKTDSCCYNPVNQNNLCNSCCDIERRSITRTLYCRALSKIFQIQTWLQKSYNRKNWLCASKLERSNLRRQGAFYIKNRWSKILLSSCDNGGSSWNPCKRSTFRSDSSSYRWESRKQSNQQLGSLHQRSAYETPQKVERVTSITALGSIPVYDLEVENDHSFEANGFLVHNCREPNLQNCPKRREDEDDPRAPIREFFVSRPGWKLISCDYVNLEAQLLAYETLDPGLISVFTQGLNLHDLNTRSMFKIGPDSPQWTIARRAAKIFFFGGISYGGGDYEIFDKVSLEAPEMHLTFAEFKKAKDNWMADHPAYVAWKKSVGDQVMETREITTEFGRKRVFLSNDKDIIKEALDYKIQSPGATLVNRAMIRISNRVKELGLKAVFVLQIHDQLVMEAPEDQADETAKIMTTELQRPFMYKGFERSIPVECEIGDNFGEV